MSVTRCFVVLVGLATVVAGGACSSSGSPLSPSAAPSAAAASAPSAASPASVDVVPAGMVEVRGVIKDIDAARMVFALQTPRGVKRVRVVERTEIILLESRQPVRFSHLAKGMNVAVRGVGAAGILHARWIAIRPRD